MREPLIGGIALLSFALFQLCLESFDELIESVKVGVSKNWAENAALWRTNQALLFPSVQVHVSRIEQFPDEIEKSLIVNFLAERRD
jgi:hypothetical protein